MGNVMALVFEPEDLVYDATERLIRIFAIDGPTPIPCAVSRAALIALEDDALAGPHAMAVTYQRNRGLIHEIAERKYQAGQFESGGSVVIRLVDIADRLEGPTRPPADAGTALDFHRTTVSGRTMASASTIPGTRRYSPTNTNRSRVLKAKLFGELRRNTLSCCWRIRISASSSTLERHKLFSADHSNTTTSAIAPKLHPIRLG
jgi:hypothetical protein